MPLIQRPSPSVSSSSSDRLVEFRRMVATYCEGAALVKRGESKKESVRARLIDHMLSFVRKQKTDKSATTAEMGMKISVTVPKQFVLVDDVEARLKHLGVLNRCYVNVLSKEKIEELWAEGAISDEDYSSLFREEDMAPRLTITPVGS